MKYFLTIAATDTSGGAGIQQDLKIADRLRFWGLSVITGITCQSFEGLKNIYPLPESVIKAQLDIVLNNFSIDCVKIGAICSADALKLIAEKLQNSDLKNIVWDPVFAPTKGKPFLDEKEIEYARKNLLPLVDLTTPNSYEFNKLFPDKNTLDHNVFLSGGHIDPASDIITEKLILNGKSIQLQKKRKEWSYSHGTGCALSSAISCNLAMNENMKSAVEKATNFTSGIFDEFNLEFQNKN